MRTIRVILGVLAAASLAACGGSGGGGGIPTSPTNTGGNTGGNNGGTTGGTPTAGQNTVTLSDNSFNPGSITVPVGTTVTWAWPTCSDNTGGYGGYGGYGSSCVAHNVTFDDGSNIQSGSQSDGTFTRTFASKGTFNYHCSIHGAGMSGKVTVQ